MPSHVEYMRDNDLIERLDRYDRAKAEQMRINYLRATRRTTNSQSNIFIQTFQHDALPRTRRVMLAGLGTGWTATRGGMYGRLTDVFVVHEDNEQVIHTMTHEHDVSELFNSGQYIRDEFVHDDTNNLRNREVCDTNSQWAIIETSNSGIFFGDRIRVMCLGCGIEGGVSFND